MLVLTLKNKCIFFKLSQNDKDWNKQNAAALCECSGLFRAGNQVPSQQDRGSWDQDQL